MKIEQIIEQLTLLMIDYGTRLLGAIAVGLLGSWIIRAIMRATSNAMEKRALDASLKPFLKSVLGTLLKIALLLSVLGMLGVEMTSFVAILGAGGLAVGMALTGTLQNFAGGVMILLFRPFKVGDTIEAQGFVGTVSEIQVFNTILKTPDNRTIVIPNGGLSTSALINYSTEPRRRVDWTIGIGYGDNVAEAEGLIRNLLAEDERIHKDPAVFIAVAELADSSVNFTVRAWVNAADYWPVFYALNRKVYESFEQAGLNIPYPQMDLHVYERK